MVKPAQNCLKCKSANLKTYRVKPGTDSAGRYKIYLECHVCHHKFSQIRRAAFIGIAQTPKIVYVSDSPLPLYGFTIATRPDPNTIPSPNAYVSPSAWSGPKASYNILTIPIGSQRNRRRGWSVWGIRLDLCPNSIMAAIQAGALVKPTKLLYVFRSDEECDKIYPDLLPDPSIFELVRFTELKDHLYGSARLVRPC